MLYIGNCFSCCCKWPWPFSSKKLSKHLDGSTNRFEDEKKPDFNIETIEMNDK
jgi:hypothetical protein